MPNVRGPRFSTCERNPSATRSSASSQLAARCLPFSRINGVFSLSLFPLFISGPLCDSFEWPMLVCATQSICPPHDSAFQRPIPLRSIPDVRWSSALSFLEATLPRESKRLWRIRSEEHTSELQSRGHLVCRL